MEVNRILAALHDYLEFMRGVDLSDQWISLLRRKKVQEVVEESFFLPSGSMLSECLCTKSTWAS